MLVYCRLPHGIVLDITENVDPVKGTTGPARTVRLNGPEWKSNGTMRMQISNFGVTKVPDDFWAEWCKRNPEFPALKSGAIFAADKEADGKALLRTMEKEKTGFEQMPKDAKGVKPRDDKEE